MDMKVADRAVVADDFGWSESFSRMSKDRRRKILDHAAGKLARATTSEGEMEMSIRQIQAALGIDPNLVLDVLAAVKGNGVSNEDIEKLKEEASTAQANFDGLVNAVQSLRTGLTEVGMIEKNADLPATVEGWRAAIGNVVARETRQLATQRDHLVEQKRELEKMRAAILDEIKAAQEQAPVLKKGMFSALKGKIAKTTKAVSALSFEYDHIEAPEVAKFIRGEGIFTRLWTPRYADGRTLPIECEIYSAREDLIHAPGVNGLLTQRDSRRATAGLKNWHGHDGGNFADDDAYIDFIGRKAKEFAAKNDISPGEWFRPDGIGVWAIPPGEIVDGKVGNIRDRVKVSDQNHFDLRHTGDFDGTFNTEYSDSDDRNWYWSSTRPRDDRDFFWRVGFRDGNGGANPEDVCQLSARLVRVRRVRHLGI